MHVEQMCAATMAGGREMVVEHEVSDELIVLLDHLGKPAGSATKQTVHHDATPLHLAFSCHVVDAAGRVLITRRAAAKRTWPGAWTNACCGHPGPGEALRDAVTRRLAHELGLVPVEMGLAIADFTYRAKMDDGTVEHELCPVVVAMVAGEPVLNPDEVDRAEWVAWSVLCERARLGPDTLTPWSRAQVVRLAPLATSPLSWLRRAGRGVGLDGLGAPPAGASASPLRHSGEPSADALGPVAQRVSIVLERFLAERTAELAELDPSLTPVGDVIAGLVSAGGTRLRPAFVYWGHRAGGADHDDGVVVVAAAMELLHTFALVHDDVMDRSSLRRGRPTAHAELGAVHRRQGLGGDDRWFGLSAAILAGDLAFVWADQLLDTAPLASDALERARQVYTRLRTEVVAGQYLDLRLAGHRTAGEADARSVALLKSARYTVTRPLQLGAALAESQPDTDQVLAVYGDAVGMAFQMRDDVLGLFGDPEETGKSCFDDLREGKRTVLMLRALELTDGEEHRVLTRSLGMVDLDQSDVDRCREVVASSGALASVEALIEAELATALDAVADLDGAARAALTQLAELAVRRGS